MSAPIHMLGAPSEVEPATAEIQAIADKACPPSAGSDPCGTNMAPCTRQVKSQLEEKENKKYPTFKATEYMSQMVAGTNYFIKVQVADDDFVHLCVFESLPQENKALALHSYQTNKTKQDQLAYF